MFLEPASCKIDRWRVISIIVMIANTTWSRNTTPVLSKLSKRRLEDLIIRLKCLKGWGKTGNSLDTIENKASERTDLDSI